MAGAAPHIRLLRRANRRALEALPETDEFPPLTRGLFTISPDDSMYSEHVTTTYRGPVIHFGGSFSSLHMFWPEWLAKFENLLRHLYWEHVALVLVTEWMGDYLYKWQASPQATEALARERPLPVTDWEFTGGPRDFGA